MPSVTSLVDLIGNTPLLRWPFRDTCPSRLLLKLERFNPTLSMKDRSAINMVRDAERRGLLKPGATIFESSSGNTATSLAMIAAARGYAFVAVVDDHCAEEKVRTIEALGGHVVRIRSSASGLPSPDEREHVARELARTTPGGFWAGQVDNPANGAGYATLAAELLEDIPDLDTLVGAVGTGGSLCGTARSLRARGVCVRVVGVEPEGSTYFSTRGHQYYQSGTGNPPGASTPQNFERAQIDEDYQVSDAAAFTTCRFLARRLGLLLGGSAGGVVLTAVQYAADHQEETVAVIVADAGEKYVSTVFDDEWLRERELFDEGTWRLLADITAGAEAVAPSLVVESFT
jgi:cystathionine beta-synthase